MEGEYPKLLDTFLDDSQKRVEALRKARDDAKALARIAHSFKGSSGNLGAVRLAHLCQRLEVESVEAAGTWGPWSIRSTMSLRWSNRCMSRSASASSFNFRRGRAFPKSWPDSCSIS